MAIALDGTSSSGSVGGTTSYSWTHVVTSSTNGALVVGAMLRGGTAVVSSVTWNGTALTFIREDFAASGTSTHNRYSSLWYYTNPGAQTGTLKVFDSGSSTWNAAMGISLTGVNQGTVVDFHAGTSHTSVQNPTMTTAFVAANAWLITAFAEGDLTTAPTAGTPANTVDVVQLNASCYHAMSYGGPYNPPAAGSARWSMGGVSNDALSIMGVTPATTTATYTPHNLGMMGVGS